MNQSLVSTANLPKSPDPLIRISFGRVNFPKHVLRTSLLTHTRKRENERLEARSKIALEPPKMSEQRRLPTVLASMEAPMDPIHQCIAVGEHD